MRYFLFAFGLILLLAGVFFIRRTESFALSPIPNVIGAKDEAKVINSWFPKLNNSIFFDAPLLSAKSAILVNYDTGEVLYSKDLQA